ncbi:hypothetical protein PM116P2_00008 [Parabacteroides phage PM116P2]|nr:hypothetical protein PM116P1_00006 [Parabacteroides phage PM116P1]WAX17427.1 hypothetical protein PM116P2_00008 [Parabacteroides phage PM116P2]
MTIEITTSKDGTKAMTKINGVHCITAEDFQRELKNVENAELSAALYSVIRMQYVIEFQ